MNIKVSLILFLAVFLSSCVQKEKETDGAFDPAASDPAAVELADSVMAAMGGAEQWENTRYISWRSENWKINWDKSAGRVRMESTGKDTIVLLNTRTDETRARVGGKPASDTLIVAARADWDDALLRIAMPFQLKRKGAVLKYLGEDTLLNGKKSNVLELTFGAVKERPIKKYRLFVDVRDNLVKQWSFYPSTEIETPEFVRPWDNYKRYAGILISAERSDGDGPSAVHIDKQVPDKIFNTF